MDRAIIKGIELLELMELNHKGNHYNTTGNKLNKGKSVFRILSYLGTYGTFFFIPLI